MDLFIIRHGQNRINPVNPGLGQNIHIHAIAMQHDGAGQVVGGSGAVLFRIAKDGEMEMRAQLAEADLAKLNHEAELNVARKIAEWPRLVEIAGRTNEPHRVAFYLYDLASDLHSLWNRGNELPELRFIQDGDIATSQAKIALARSVAVVISAGLGILGVTPAEEMR